MSKFLLELFGRGIAKLFRYGVAISFIFFFCKGDELLQTELDAINILSIKALQIWKEAEKNSAEDIANAHNNR